MERKPSAKHEEFVRNAVPERNEQEPLGPHPSYDKVLDVAVEYTFPASDPLAVDSCCKTAGERRADGEVDERRPTRDDKPR